FCLACGRPVGATATEPSADLTPVAAATEPVTRLVAPEAYTPRHLAERILTSRAALEGERKLVTVLFCDLTGSTALAERLGAEAMHALLTRFFDLAVGEVHRYEGTINQFLGDGFMALFGAPVAHEDHARRAVLAASAIHRRLAQSPVQVKGKAEPVTPFRLLGVAPVRSALGSAAGGRLGPFVGRAAELAALRARLGALEGGHGHVVDVVGEAGMGKSRLLV